ncbi:MAG: hypothetical protein BDTLLHRC_000914 [Candidatus Fervidibacter sp.]
MAWRPQLYPPERRITVHSLRLLHESLQHDEQPILQISADFRDDPPTSGLAAFWLWLLEMWLYRLWCVCTWGEPRMLLVTDRRLLTAVSLELTEIPFAAVEDITLRRTWDEFGVEVGEIVVTYEGGRRATLSRTCGRKTLWRGRKTWVGALGALPFGGRLLRQSVNVMPMRRKGCPFCSSTVTACWKSPSIKATPHKNWASERATCWKFGRWMKRDPPNFPCVPCCHLCAFAPPNATGKIRHLHRTVTKSRLRRGNLVRPDG